MTRIVGVLLAAGRGRRFDASGERDKLLQPLDGVPVAERAARTLLAACDATVAVVRPGRDALVELLRGAGCEVVVCDDADAGMGHSLAAGVRAARRLAADAIAVMPADLPRLSAQTVRRLLARPIAADGIVAPRHRGRRGHPVVFGSAHFDALSVLTGDEGARRLLNAHPVAAVDVDDAGVVEDVDTPLELEAGDSGRGASAGGQPR